MVILALDTTTRGGSCALTRGDVLVLEQQGEPERPQAARLPDDLMRLLTHAGAALADVDVFAVATGPGSFTGLRIGIAAMQGLAFAGGKPLVGISALDALASTTHHPPSTAHQPAPATHAWIDAWRGEVYAATYLDGHEVEPPVVARPADLLREVGERRRLRTESVFIGNGAVTYRELILSTLGRLATIAEPAAPPLAAAIAGLAFEEAQAGRLAPSHAIMPVYVRRTYAELAREREAVIDACRFEPLGGEEDLQGVLEVEGESFTNPWTREMYAWELQNRAVCHIYVARATDCPVAGFCAFWLVFDEIHINNIALRRKYRGQGMGTALMRHVLREATRLGAHRATLEVRASNEPARRLYERLGFHVAGTRRNYYSNPVEDALILWRDETS